MDDTQTKSAASFVRVRRIEPARDSEDNTNDQFIDESMTNKKRASSSLNQNNSTSITVNRASLNTSLKVGRKVFLLDHIFLSIELAKIMILLSFQ